MTAWEEIQQFAKKLVGLTDADVETWIEHALIRRCSCPVCQKHTLYTHITEALEKWEARKGVPDHDR